MGNLVSRILTLAEKEFNGKIKKCAVDKGLSLKLNVKDIDKSMVNYSINEALNEIWKFINECNKHVNQEKLWEKKGKDLEKHLYTLLESIRIIAILLESFIPSTSGKIFGQLGINCEGLMDAKFGLVKEYTVKKGEILFNKLK